MNYTDLTEAINIREIAHGLLIFVALLLAIPFIVVFLASLGPNEWMHIYIAPFLEYKFLLILLSGICIGFVSKHSPIATSAVVGILGGIIIAIIYISSTALSDQAILTSNIYWIILKYLTLCTTGGLFVASLRLVRSRL